MEWNFPIVSLLWWLMECKCKCTANQKPRNENEKLTKMLTKRSLQSTFDLVIFFVVFFYLSHGVCEEN